MRYPPPPDDWIIKPEDEFGTFSVVTDLALTAEVLVQVSRSAKLDGCFKIQLGGRRDRYSRVPGKRSCHHGRCSPIQARYRKAAQRDRHQDQHHNQCMVRPRRKVKIHNINRNDFKKINISVARVAVPDLRGSGICMDPEFFSARIRNNCPRFRLQKEEINNLFFLLYEFWIACTVGL